MISGIVGNLIADVIWAPLVWLTVRELRRYRASVEKSHAKTHRLVAELHQQLTGATPPEGET